jgi:hypothetical protein
LVVLTTTTLYSQDINAENYEKKYPPDSLRVWTLNTLDEVIESHPGMYRYTSKETFDDLIHTTLQSINDSLTTLAYYRKLKPLFAKIGCLHTSVTLSDPYRNYYEGTLKFIPIGIFIDSNKKVYITENYSTAQSIPLKSEIIAINNQPIAAVLDTLYEAIPSDGYNQTLKSFLLNHTFPLWYQSILSTSNTYRIDVKENGRNKTYHLEGISRDELPSLEIDDTENVPLEFEIKDSIGYLTIKTFSHSMIKYNEQKFKKFIKIAFEKLQQHEVENLIVDVRGNTGGTDGYAAYLTSFFFDKPFKYWQHPVELTKPMGESFKTWYGIFYKMPKKIGDVYQWKGMHGWLSKAFSYYKTQKPARHNYKGNVYLLTNGACMSSCADVVAILSHNKKAKVVGEETGGGYQGNTSGMMPTMNIQPNLTMTIPLQKYTNAVDPSIHIGRGTIPDYPIIRTLDDWMNEKDMQLESVKQLIKNHKQ